MIIPPEAVQAAKTMHEAVMLKHADWTRAMSAALEAAAPLMRANGDMNPSEFSAESRARGEAPNGFRRQISDWPPSDRRAAVDGALDIVEKRDHIRDGASRNEHGSDDLQKMLADEIADTYIYLDLFARRAGIDLAAAVREAFDRKRATIRHIAPRKSK